jgi:tape measure domain-containing protein
MATERIDIVVQEQGSKVVKRNLSDIGTTAETSAGGVDLLSGALKALTAYFSVTAIVSFTKALVDANIEMQRIQFTMQQAFGGDAPQQMQFISDLSEKLGLNLRDTATGYAQLAASAQGTSVQTKDLQSVFVGLSEAATVLHSSTEDVNGVFTQLAQGVSLGKLQMQDIRAIAQHLPGTMVLLQETAQRMGTTLSDALAHGCLDAAKALGILGDVLHEKFGEGAVGASQSLNAQLNRLYNTIFLLMTTGTDFEATMAKAIADLTKTLQQGGVQDAIRAIITIMGTAASLIVGALKLLADNLKIVLSIAVGIGVAWAVWTGVPAIISAVTAAVRLLTAAVMTNPIGLMVTALAAAITYFGLFGDGVNAGIDDVTTMKDVLMAFKEEAVAAFEAVVEAASDLWTGMVSLAQTAYDDITKSTTSATDSWTDSYSDFYSGLDKGFAGAVEAAAKTVDAIAGLLTGLGIAFVRVFSGLPALVSGIFGDMYNAVVGWIEKMINSTIDGINRLRALVGKEGIQQVELAREQVAKDYGKAYVSNLKDAFDEGFAIQGGFLENWVKGVFDRAQQIAKSRKPAAGASTGGTSGGGIGTGTTQPDPNAAKARDQLAQQLDRLLSSLNRVYAAQSEVTRATKLLDAAQKAGLITATQRAAILAEINDKLRDQLDPLGAVNRQLEQQSQLLALNAQQRQVETQLLRIEQQLRQQGKALSDTEIEQLRTKLQLIQQETLAAQARDAVYNATIGKQQQFATQLSAINQLLAAGTITREQADQYLVQSQQTMLQGTQEAMQAQLQTWRDTYSQIDQMRQADLISDQTANQLKRRADADLATAKLANQRSFYSQLATLSNSSNRTLAAIGKAAAVTQATIDGVLAVQKALASAPPPANFALAAAVGVAAAANVAQILSQNTQGYAFGGDFKVGGVGGTDSQLVAFRATPGERVRVSTPAQDSARGDGGGAAPQVNQKIINVLDPSIVGDFLATEDGQQVLVNVLDRNGIKRS